MFWFLHAALTDIGRQKYFKVAAAVLFAWIVALKYIKIAAHFRKHPQDHIYFPIYLLFGYWCTFIKIWAMFTCWNASWAIAKDSNNASVAEASPIGSKESRDSIATTTAVVCREDSTCRRTGWVSLSRFPAQLVSTFNRMSRESSDDLCLKSQFVYP